MRPDRPKNKEGTAAEGIEPPLPSSRYMFGQLWVAPDELPGLVDVEGEVLHCRPPE